MKKNRESNFELLRIISMFMVLVLHADFQALGEPTTEDIVNTPFSSFIKVLFEVLSIVAVNVFVLISGWFGIKPSIKGFAKLIFQILFFSFGIYIVMALIGKLNFSISGIAHCLVLKPATSYWFIPSYLCLYLFAPVLNSFIALADKKSYIGVLVAFFAFQTICSFVSNSASFLMKGYSALSFMGLYLLAAYVKKYVDFNKYKGVNFALGYLIISLLLTVIFIFAKFWKVEAISSRMFCYSNPLNILSALLLLLCFCKMHFKSKMVNKIAINSFAVYLLHCNPFMYSYYLDSIRCISSSNVLFKILYILLCICIWFIISILLDRLRSLIWKLLSHTINAIALYTNAKK